MTENNRSNRIAAMLETAYAYTRRKDAIQYSNSELTPIYRYMNGPIRRTDGFSPEEATQDHYRFTVCSSFFYNLLWDTFRYRFCGDIQRHPCAVSEIFYKSQTVYEWEKGSGKTVTMAIREMLPMVQAGDAFEFAHHNNAARHIMLIGENGVMLHSNGANYDWNKSEERWESDGSIRITSIEEFMLHALGELPIQHYDSLRLIRILDAVDPNRFPLTPQAESRLKYPGLDIDRRCNRRAWQSVCPGETLTYTLRLTNTNPFRENHRMSQKIFRNLQVEEILPEGTELVISSLTGDVTIQDGVLRWNVDIGTEQTVVLQYSVKVKEDLPFGSSIVSEGGHVDNIPTNRIVTPVGNCMTQQQWLTLQGLATSDALEKAEIMGDGIAQWVYRNILDMQISIPTAAELIDAQYLRGTCTHIDNIYPALYHKEAADKDNGNACEYKIPEMEGGRALVCVDGYHRILELRGENLQAGDVIVIAKSLAGKDVEAEQILCLGGNMCVKSAGGSFEIAPLPHLDGLFAKDYFAVLRPIMYR